MRKSVYKAGKTILREGEKTSDAYVIVDGIAEVYRKTFDGSEIILSKLGKNQMFGEISLIDNAIPRTANVRAVTDVVVAVVSPDSFNEKLDKTHPSIRSILKVMAKRIADSNDLVISLYSKIDQLVQEKVGSVLEENKRYIDSLKEKDERIAELEAELEELKVSGPPKRPSVPQKRPTEGQKLDKDRSMKLSLKDLDKMMNNQDG